MTGIFIDELTSKKCIKHALRFLKMLGELLVSFFYSTFIVCFGAAFLCAVFLQFGFTLVFMVAPFVGMGAGLPGLILFGWPLCCLMDFFGFKRPIYWVFLGVFVSVFSYYFITYLLNIEVELMILLLASIIGLVTASRVRYQFYLGEEKI